MDNVDFSFAHRRRAQVIASPSRPRDRKPGQVGDWVKADRGPHRGRVGRVRSFLTGDRAQVKFLDGGPTETVRVDDLIVTDAPTGPRVA